MLERWFGSTEGLTLSYKVMPLLVHVGSYQFLNWAW